jgi:hypothetical protein
MKVLDQMSGLKIAAGDPILHLGLFIATLYLPKQLVCDGADYGNTIVLLCVSHAINSARFLIKFASEQLTAAKPEWRFGM